ncbi:MAG: nicotinamide-nucleotide amidase [Symbiopectobacterium sp.]
METEILRLSAKIGVRLTALGAKVTCAESCTGGWIAKSITEVVGSSGWFDYGFVTYSNQAKQRLIGVSEGTLAQYGAVSEQTVREMAQGALRAAGADYSLSVSGIAGPGSDKKSVGTVWFGWCDKHGNLLAREMLFLGDRHAVRLQAVRFALQMLLDGFLQK